MFNHLIGFRNELNCARWWLSGQVHGSITPRPSHRHPLHRKDYYDLLHVSRHADAAAIKRAYRKVALKYHPDKVQGTEEEKQAAAKTFAEIGHGGWVGGCCFERLPGVADQQMSPLISTDHVAYEVLTDEKKRQIYDQYGEEGLKQMGNSGGGHHNPNDIFAQ